MSLTNTSAIQPLNTYGDSQLTDLLKQLQDAIMTYQGVQHDGWDMSSNRADPQKQDVSVGFEAKRNDFLTQQKLINLQAQRDNVMQKLVGDYQNNTNMYGSSLKLNATKDYVGKLQDTLTNINRNKLGAINSDIMTHSRLASINIEKHNQVSRINKYFAVTIVFLAVFLVLCIVAYLNLAWLPDNVMYLLLGLSVLAYLGVIGLKLYIDGRQYRMLRVEKEFEPPMEDPTVANTNTCTTCCPSTTT